MRKLTTTEKRFYDDFEAITGKDAFTKSSVEAGTMKFADAKQQEVRMFENWALDAVRQVTNL